MVFPKLKKSGRFREFNNFSNIEKAKGIYGYLFDSLSHRKLDKSVLGLDESFSKGYQSMSILHCLGLVGTYKGIFDGKDIDFAISEMENSDAGDFSEIIDLISILK